MNDDYFIFILTKRSFSFLFGSFFKIIFFFVVKRKEIHDEGFNLLHYYFQILMGITCLMKYKVIFWMLQFLFVCNFMNNSWFEIMSEYHVYLICEHLVFRRKRLFFLGRIQDVLRIPEF